MIQYGDYDMSAERHFYARKRAGETPFEYLYRFNVAEIRAKIWIRDGSPSIQREHVKPFYQKAIRSRSGKTAGVVTPADEMEEALRVHQRMEV